MTLIKFTDVSLASGKIGGTVYSTGNSGQYSRKVPRKFRTDSVKQNFRQQGFNSISKRWRQLNDSQRTAWNDLAATIVRYNRVGTLIRVTGFNYFMELSLTLKLTQGNFFLSSVPAIPTVYPVINVANIDINTTDGIGAINFVMDSSFTSDGVITIAVFAAPPKNVGSKYSMLGKRFVTSFLLTKNVFQGSISVAVGWNNAFGNNVNKGNRYDFELFLFYNNYPLRYGNFTLTGLCTV